MFLKEESVRFSGRASTFSAARPYFWPRVHNSGRAADFLAARPYFRPRGRKSGR
jgi:hypothetical protein